MADRIIIACCIALAIVYFYGTSQIPSLEIGDPLGPKAFPILLGIALLCATALLVVEHIKAGGTAAAPAPKERRPDRRHLPVLGVVVVWMAVYFAVFETLGYVVATTLFLFPVMAWFNRGKWLANGLSAAFFSIGSYAMFTWLDVTLPHGVLPF